MPRVSRPAPARVSASPDAVRQAAIDELGASADPSAAGDGTTETLVVASEPDTQPAAQLTITLSTGGDDTTLVAIHSSSEIAIPFFGWFFKPLVALERRRAREHALAVLQANAA